MIATITKLTILAILLLATTSHASFRELFEKEFMSNPWGGNREAHSACVECHASEMMKAPMREPVFAWRDSWHAQNEVSCHDCHGGGPDDASMSMSHQRGFKGTPTLQEIPQFCGKCHLGILQNFLESGHGKALLETNSGPNCVTCHGSHDIKPASIDIINEQRCSQCHLYDRAMLMRQALFTIEKRLSGIQTNLNELRESGILLQTQRKDFFRAHSDFRTLFHTIDVNLVKEKTDEFMGRLDRIETDTRAAYVELAFRKNFSGYLLLLFLFLAFGTLMLIRTGENKK